MVSIIIPVYNAERFLKKSVDSAIKQTYKDIEIILVDDGSNDNSSKICDEYGKNDNRVKVIHKKNGGLSDARNVGIEKAKGEFLIFLDSDDYMPLDFVEVAIKEKENADILIMKMCYVHEDTDINLNSFDENINKKYLNSEEAIEESLYQKLFNCSVSSKLYKKSLFNNIKFPVGKLSEDLAISHLLFNNAKEIIYIDKVGYYYRQQNSSIMHIFNSRRLDAIMWAKKIEEFCKQKYPRLINAAKCRTFNVSVHLLLDLPNEGQKRDSCYHIIMNEIKRTRLTTIFNSKARNRERLAALLTFFGEKTVKKVWNSNFASKRELITE